MTDEKTETRPFWATERTISHIEARASAARLINSHFRNPDENARVSIPADPERDDDLIIMAYIWQQEHGAAQETVL
jgi:hypothetical protein